MNKPNLSKIEIILLKYAFRASDGIFIGGITTKLGMSIKDAVSAFRNLQRLGFLEQKESVLYLTSQGRSWVMENQEAFAFSGKKIWRETPHNFISNTIFPYEPYVPRLSKLSKNAFGVGITKRR